MSSTCRGFLVLFCAMNWVAPGLAIELRGTQSFALDQPRVYALLERPGQTGPLSDAFGAFTLNPFLDTGASGVILSRESAQFLGVQKQVFGGQDVEFANVGATGSANFGISEVLNIGVAPFNPAVPLDDLSTISTTYTQRLDNVRVQLEKTFSSSPVDVLGMPALVGKVAVLDPKPVDNLLQPSTINSYIYNPGTPFNASTQTTNPGIPETTHHVQLSFGDFSRFTSVSPAGGESPTLARSPFIGPDPISALDQNPPVDNTPPVEFSWQGASTTGSLLFDTGAGVSFMSRNLASDLNIRYRPGTFGSATPTLERYNPVNPGQLGTLITDQFRLNVGGVGGNLTFSGFYLDTLLLKTTEGDASNDDDPNHIEFVRAPILINDIQLRDPASGDLFTLDGVFGMNYLAASANVGSIAGVPVLKDETPGNFEWVVYDDPNRLLGLTPKPFTPLLGDFNSNGAFDCGDIDGLVRSLSSHANDVSFDMNSDGKLKRNDLAAWLAAAGSLAGDADLDGMVNGDDLAIWKNHAFSGATSWCSGDFNVDGVTDVSDFNVWLENNGTSAAALNASVPEPSAWTLLAFVAALLPAVRRRWTER